MTTGSLARSQDASVGVQRRALGLLYAVAMTLFAVLLLLPGTTESGGPMDEGAVLAYSDRVLEGAVPHRDFLTFYGPGNLWAVAGAFKLFGTSVATERGVAVLYELLVVLSLFLLARQLAGNGAGLASGAVAVLILNGELVWAYATFGALAAGLGGLALAATAAASTPGRRQDVLLLGAGAAAGVALLMRFDFAPAIVLSALPLLLYVGSRARIWYAAGFAGLAGLYVPHLVLVGPEKIERVARDLLASGPGRSLPVPGPFGYPGTVLAAAVLGTVLLVVAGLVLSRRRPAELAGRILLAAGLLNVGLLPYAFSRPDEFHVEPVAIIPLSVAPALALWLVRPPRVSTLGRVALTIALLAIVAVVVVDGRGLQLDRVDPPRIENASRAFPYWNREWVTTVNTIVARLERDSRAGESLFVGPQDLRRTNYGPTFVYFLVPKLAPASYYMEMNPGTASDEDSGLADELRRADWLILTSDWDDWNEPNDSRKFGSAEPNQVVRDLFCQRLQAGGWRLYERCDRS